MKTELYSVEVTLCGVIEPITLIRVSAASKAEAVMEAVNTRDVLCVYSVERIKDDTR